MQSIFKAVARQPTADNTATGTAVAAAPGTQGPQQTPIGGWGPTGEIVIIRVLIIVVVISVVI